MSRPGEPACQLTWRPITGGFPADQDQSADLPGTMWAEVGPGHPQGWTYTILDGGVVITEGQVDTERAAKRAVQVYADQANPSAPTRTIPPRGNAMIDLSTLPNSDAPPDLPAHWLNVGGYEAAPGERPVVDITFADAEHGTVDRFRMTDRQAYALALKLLFACQP